MGIFFMLDTKTLTNTKRNKNEKDYGKHFKNRKARPTLRRQSR